MGTKGTALEMRVIDVRTGDVYGVGYDGCDDVIVVGVGAGPAGLHSQVIHACNGKRTNIQTARLQAEYNRRGTVAARRAHRRLAELLKNKREAR